MPVSSQPSDAAMLTITVNGEARQVGSSMTVRELIDDMGLKGRAVAVERNRQVVPRREHQTQCLGEGDTLEIVTLVGGG